MLQKPSEMENNQRIFWGWYMVGGAFLIVGMNYGDLYCFGVFLKPMAAEFHLSRLAISVAAEHYFHRNPDLEKGKTIRHLILR